MIMTPDGYALEYSPLWNLITITLPQTDETFVSSVLPYSKRRVDVSTEELTCLLNLVQYIFEGSSNSGTPEEEVEHVDR